jgi:hypothetical protein
VYLLSSKEITFNAERERNNSQRTIKSACVGLEHDPSRAHRLAAIYEDSTLWLWDMRNLSAPTNEIKFADYSGTNCFICSSSSILVPLTSSQ